MNNARPNTVRKPTNDQIAVRPQMHRLDYPVLAKTLQHVSPERVDEVARTLCAQLDQTGAEVCDIRKLKRAIRAEMHYADFCARRLARESAAYEAMHAQAA